MTAMEHYPSSSEYLVVGVVGILLNFLVVFLASTSLLLGTKSTSTKQFFICIIVMATLELPRFFMLSIDRAYKSRPAYCVHILAGVFFFIAFSIVCRQWSGLLQLGSYFRVVYGVTGLIVANVVFAIVDVVSIIACATYSSLDAYFDSLGFEVLTFIEGVRNCVYSVFLTYYGIKLVKRFWHFSNLERLSSRLKRPMFYHIFHSAVMDPGGTSTSSRGTTTPSSATRSSSVASGGIDSGRDNVFTKVLLRLTSALILTTACYLLRVCMLLAKMIAIHSENITITTQSFTLFGVLWFTFSDFIPRTLPTLAFIFLMRTKKQAGSESQGLSSQQKRSFFGRGRRISKENGGAEEFQFVTLNDEEEGLDYYEGIGAVTTDGTGVTSGVGSARFSTSVGSGKGSSGKGGSGGRDVVGGNRNRISMLDRNSISVQMSGGDDEDDLYEVVSNVGGSMSGVSLFSIASDANGAEEGVWRREGMVGIGLSDKQSKAEAINESILRADQFATHNPILNGHVSPAGSVGQQDKILAGVTSTSTDMGDVSDTTSFLRPTSAVNRPPLSHTSTARSSPTVDLTLPRTGSSQPISPAYGGGGINPQLQQQQQQQHRQTAAAMHSRNSTGSSSRELDASEISGGMGHSRWEGSSDHDHSTPRGIVYSDEEDDQSI